MSRFKFLIHWLSIAIAAQVLFAPNQLYAEEVDPFLIPARDGPSEQELRLMRRHRILQVHQAVGYATLTLVTTQVALGWANYGIYRRRGLTPTWDNLRQAHFYFGLTSFASYWTGASLAIFAPKVENLHENERAEGSLRTHKRLAWVHGIGMGILPVWGWLTTEYRSELFGKANGKGYDYVAAAHGSWGTVTWGALAGAYISVMLK